MRRQRLNLFAAWTIRMTALMALMITVPAYAEDSNDYMKRWEQWQERRHKEVEIRREELENIKQEILNSGLVVDVQLKQSYLNAYNNYVYAYKSYIESLTTMYRQQDRLRSGLMWSYGRMRKYQSQVNICNARLKNMWRAQIADANLDFWNSRIHWSNIGNILRAGSSLSNGEACVHKVLLDFERKRRFTMGMADELVGLRFQLIDQNRSSEIKLMCPSEDPRLTAQALGEGDFMNEYPPIVSSDDGEFQGYYWPVTYFQLYTILTDHSSAYTIARPEVSASPACDMRHPVNKKFYQMIHGKEAELAVDFDDMQAGTIQQGRYLRDYGQTKNQAYRQVIDTMRTIYEQIDACVAGNTQIVMPDVGDPMHGEFDPTLPSMSRSLRACYMFADTYRQQALDNEEIMLQIIRSLAEAKIDPPREPKEPWTKPIGQ